MRKQKERPDLSGCLERLAEAKLNLSKRRYQLNIAEKEEEGRLKEFERMIIAQAGPYISYFDIRASGIISAVPEPGFGEMHRQVRFKCDTWGSYNGSNTVDVVIDVRDLSLPRLTLKEADFRRHADLVKHLDTLKKSRAGAVRLMEATVKSVRSLRSKEQDAHVSFTLTGLVFKDGL